MFQKSSLNFISSIRCESASACNSLPHEASQPRSSSPTSFARAPPLFRRVGFLTFCRRLHTVLYLSPCRLQPLSVFLEPQRCTKIQEVPLMGFIRHGNRNTAAAAPHLDAVASSRTHLAARRPRRGRPRAFKLLLRPSMLAQSHLQHDVSPHAKQLKMLQQFSFI